jgi:hypothetical protein
LTLASAIDAIFTQNGQPLTFGAVGSATGLNLILADLLTLKIDPKTGFLTGPKP